MTVQELIDELERLPDKSLEVQTSDTLPVVRVQPRYAKSEHVNRVGKRYVLLTTR